MPIRKFLAAALGLLTGTPRYLPAIEWSSRSWTHNAFRLWELAFGKPLYPTYDEAGKVVGWGSMRAEVSVGVYREHGSWGKPIVVRQFHTAEAAIAHAESAVREYVSRLAKGGPKREWKRRAVFVPALSGVGPSFGIPSPIGYLFAIAYDSVSTLQDSSSASSLSVAFSTSGSDRLLVGAIKAYRNPNNTGLVTAFTYNSVGLTGITNSPQTPVQTNGRLYMSYLVAPATGSNTLSCTFQNSATNGSMVATLYTGAKQTGQPDATTNGAAGGSGATATMMVVAANSWLVLAAMSMFGPNSIAASTGATERASGGNPDLFLGDSNGAVAAGSQSIAFTCGTDNYGYLAASFAPAASLAGGNFLQMFWP